MHTIHKKSLRYVTTNEQLVTSICSKVAHIRYNIINESIISSSEIIQSAVPMTDDITRPIEPTESSLPTESYTCTINHSLASIAKMKVDTGTTKTSFDI
jgi:hypothetical protein